MDREQLRSSMREIRVKPATWTRTFEAPLYEARDELIRFFT
jgi:hypothetical protein